jgi:hypothetical protein
MAHATICQIPRGATYCLAQAPALWFWVSMRSNASHDEDSFIVARQHLLEIDVLNSRGSPARPS